ncbi:MAG: SDR family NAD(P)-dependent oxidoreductase [Sphingorhabdus sp.]
MTERRLEGKVAIVTGAAGGMGRGYALHLAKLGADIAIFDKDLDVGKRYGEYSADSVAQEIRDLGRRVTAVQADLSNRAEAKAAVEQAARELGPIDILVNNAGGSITPANRSFATVVPDEDIELLLGANFLSAVYCCQAAVPLMTRPGGSIINVVTFGVFASDSTGQGSVYSAAKAALHTYTRHLAVEVGPSGIRANCIAPGLILTPRVAAAAAERGLGTSDQTKSIPLRRFGTVDDMVGTVEFLASDMSKYITGECICVTGGLGLVAV